MTTPSFLAALQATVADLRATVQTELATLGPAQLNQRLAPASWSILECLTHLNAYSRYYNAACARALARPGAGPAGGEVSYSWLGRKAIALVHPTNRSKQKALKRLNPLGSRLGAAEVLHEFDQHQARLLVLLAQAGQADLNGPAVPVEFFRLLKLRLGEALEFVVVHQQRHVQQAQRVRAELVGCE